MQQVIELEHRLHLAEQSIGELEKSNHQLYKEVQLLKELIKILNQRITQPNLEQTNPTELPPHY